jgi:hypothetical protein
MSDHEHKAELRARVEERRRELQRELDSAEEKRHPPERVHAIETELRIVDDALGGGWGCVGEVTSQQLARWLEATRHLVSEEEDDLESRITAEYPAQYDL